jgi:hypothetical protein
VTDADDSPPGNTVTCGATGRVTLKTALDLGRRGLEEGGGGGFGIHTVLAAGKDNSRVKASGNMSVADIEAIFDAKWAPGRNIYGGSGGSLEPPGPLLTHPHTVYMAYSECLPTRLTPLAERTCFSQVGGRHRARPRGPGGALAGVPPRALRPHARPVHHGLQGRGRPGGLPVSPGRHNDFNVYTYCPRAPARLPRARKTPSWPKS